jgi:hypothetical protein
VTASAVSTPLVIGGRYLASAAAFEARPQGPLDALDTSTGRAAQVRIVFAADGWDDDGFDEAVARWCALACPGVCGILDHGRHEHRRYLVVPPALGMSIERWRATRRPAPAESARLTLGFGRLAERIAAAGFPVDAAGLADLAVGPGPTPFIELPLLGDPAVNDVLITAGAGQRTLAAVLRAASDAPAEPLAAWLERARSAGFASLAECLDELERCAGAAAAGVEEGTIGLDGLFDEDDAAFEARLLPPEPRRWPQRLAGGLGLAALLALALAAIGQGGGGHEAAAARPPALRPVVESTLKAPQQLHHPARHRHRPAKRHHPAAHATRHHVSKHQTHAHPRPTPPAPTPTPTPQPPPAPPPSPPSRGSGGATLPDPGQLPTLPAPG